MNLQVFFTKKCLAFFKEAGKESFYVKINSVYVQPFFISTEKFCLVLKETKKNYMKKIREFVGSEFENTCLEHVKRF